MINVPAFRGRSPRLSLVVVCYNMARELPRTLQTLSARMQQGIGEKDYEIIVVDNGSSRPADQDACRRLGKNIRFLSTPSPNASPARAIAWGVRHARHAHLGIFIDGARMASPGLLARAREALSLAPDTVVGTIGFHLGDEVQMDAVHKGYDQSAEDRLLDGAGWQADGYRLFSISCLAGSSAGGWFVLPPETNALFLSRALYHQLGGFDEAFTSSGGGLINHDFWNRVCESDRARIVMLLGEGTFHQFHGGAATNARISPWQAFTEEYARIRGRPYAPARKAFTLYGATGHLPQRHAPQGQK